MTTFTYVLFFLNACFLTSPVLSTNRKHLVWDAFIATKITFAQIQHRYYVIEIKFAFDQKVSNHVLQVPLPILSSYGCHFKNPLMQISNKVSTIIHFSVLCRIDSLYCKNFKTKSCIVVEWGCSDRKHLEKGECRRVKWGQLCSVTVEVNLGDYTYVVQTMGFHWDSIFVFFCCSYNSVTAAFGFHAQPS